MIIAYTKESNEDLAKEAEYLKNYLQSNSIEFTPADIVIGKIKKLS